MGTLELPGLRVLAVDAAGLYRVSLSFRVGMPTRSWPIAAHALVEHLALTTAVA